MTSPVYRKTRTICDAESVTATTSFPTFEPFATAQVVANDGAMGGASIGAAQLTVASWLSLTTIDVKLQTSEDGSVWSDVKDTAGNSIAFAQLSAAGVEELPIPDHTPFLRFVRAYITVVGSGSAVVTVKLRYSQTGNRDLLAPPGSQEVNG